MSRSRPYTPSIMRKNAAALSSAKKVETPKRTGWDKIGNDHFSHSQMNMWLRCPKQFEFRYVMGKKRPPNSSLVLGTTSHAGFEVNYRSKFRTGKPAPREETHAAFEKAFDEAKHDADFEGQKPGQVKDRGIMMLDVHYDEIAPRVKPIAEPEMELRFRIPGMTRDVLGYIDVISQGTGGEIIRDSKTTGKKKGPDEAKMSHQIPLYALGRKITAGAKVVGGTLDVVIANKSGTDSQILPMRVTQADLDNVAKDVLMVDKAIKAGVFPRTGNAQVCGWCGYRDICPGRA